MDGLRWHRALLGVYVAALSPAAAAESRPATATTEQVLKGLENVNTAVRAWCIEYEGDGPKLPYYVHRTLAVRFPDSCLYRGAKGPADSQDLEDGVARTSWREHPFQDWVLVTSNRNYWGKPWDRELGEFALARDAPLPAKMQSEVLFMALGWWTFQDRPSPQLEGDIPRSIPDIVRSKRYSVAAEQDMRDGIWCHVLQDPGRDRIWIDCARSFAIIARETSDITTGAPIAQVVMSGHREDKPGIWVPREIRNIQFNYHAPTPEGWRERLIDARVRILDVRLNEHVDESVFRLGPMPAGTVRLDPDGRYEQVEPGGFDHMDYLAEWLRSGNRGSPPTTNWAAVLDYAAIAAAAVIIAAVGYWRFARGRRRSGPAGLSAAAET
jgi:hypothetical protein